MKLNRIKLMTLVKAAVDGLDARQAQWDADVNEAEVAWEKRWKENLVPQWRPFRDLLTKALKTGAHITQADLPITLPTYGSDPIKGPLYRPFNRGKYEGYTGNRKWVADHKYGPRPVHEKETLENVLLFLEMVEEEIITTGQLANAGFRNLEKLISAAATAGAWSDAPPKVAN